MIGGSKTVRFTGLGHHVADVDSRDRKLAKRLPPPLHHQVGNHTGEETARAEHHGVGAAQTIGFPLRLDQTSDSGPVT